jgi:hypothetical protein
VNPSPTIALFIVVTEDGEAYGRFLRNTDKRGEVKGEFVRLNIQ